MRSRFGWLVLFAVGCSDTAGPPVQTAKPVEKRNDGVPVFPLAAAPKASDPAAAATAAKILAAHTDGNPALVEKVRTVRVTRAGKQLGQGEAGSFPVSFEFVGQWSDTCKYSFRPVAGPGITLLRVGGRSTRSPEQPPLTESEIAAFHRDAFGEWLLLSVPLADPRAVFAPGPEEKVDGKSYPSVRLWLAEAPQVIIHYDPATYRVVQWSYNGLSAAGGEVQIDLVPSKYESRGGLLYPELLTVRHAGKEMVTCHQSTVEFPKTFDKDTFTLPKQ
jgi:hypothetical protein